MSTKASSVAFVCLLLFSLMPTTPAPPASTDLGHRVLSDDLFSGFLVGAEGDVWNQTPFSTVAVPEGFTYQSVIDYSDVGVLINNRSEESKTIGWAFVAARNISLDRVFIFDHSDTPTDETINRNRFNTYFALPFLEMLQNRSSANGLNYLVTTKGIPLRISGGNDKASFDQELALLGGAYNSTIGGDYWNAHGYGPLAGKAMEPFSRNKYGFFLVTRLTGYTVDTALELIERANQSLGQRGTFVLDLATNRNESGYKFWNDDLYTANSTLNGTMGLPVHFDEETNFVTNISSVMGYASWGSNDGNWNANTLPNGGFDTLDASWESGSRYWNTSSPVVAPEDDFEWRYQTETKEGGSGAFEASLRTDCSQDSGKGMQGIYAEYFDNDGVSFSTASMPLLIDREPDRVQIEPDLNHGSSYNAYSGLDDRFKENWGARFSGFVDLPQSGSWTFFINSDDGTELWVNGVSIATNYGSHGMRERSGQLNLTEGLHEFRIEFFQGGGPHGLIFSWQGPGTSKAPIPASAFRVASDVAPRAADLMHHWAFEDNNGSVAVDNGTEQANLTLSGMDNTNWRACPDGSCLWFDGVNDVARVDVEDVYGNLTVSQWVWANTTSQSTYASTFAVNDQAGSNLSFQHMVQNNKWRLHNNQTKAFGDVVAQRWTHLVSVFDNGDIRQYMDGVLVNDDTYPNGSFVNVDLYKIGVNRAGNSYFEGMIDEIMVWDVALTDQDVTRLRRTIVDNCTAYSGAGVDAAQLETTFTVPSQFAEHAWILSVSGKRNGEVNGAFGVSVLALDATGNVLTSNSSDKKTFTTSWASQNMRFRPDANTASFVIRATMDIDAISSVGSLFIDSVRLYPIRPDMDWVNGSIAETAVSTGGRSFEWGTEYGQSLIADLLEDGVSGVKGYVYEPYLIAVGLPSAVLPTYASGYNLAESHAAASLFTSWMGVVVGDPKMAPFVDVLHDVNIVDVRTVGHVNFGENTTLELLVENLGMAAANGSIEIRTVLGNNLLHQSNLSLPPGDQSGSRATLNLSFVPPNSGFLDLRIRYVNATPERNYENNLRSTSLVVNAPPSIEDVYCSASVLSRGEYTTCSVVANDDIGIINASLQWQILAENTSVDEAGWLTLAMGQVNPTLWETALIVPPEASLGDIVVRAVVEDGGEMSAVLTVENVVSVVDAPPTWYGPHVSGVDPPDWNNASALPNKPSTGLLRQRVSTLTACVMDADYRLEDSMPMFLTNRGVLGNTSYQEQSIPHLYCYISTLALELGSSLDEVDLQLRTESGSLLLQRTLMVADLSPEISIDVETTEGQPLDRVVGGGDEQLRISVTDADDPDTPFVGDVTLRWPGGEPIQLPLDIPQGGGGVVVALEKVMVPLEAGDLQITVSGRGQHGATATKDLSVPFLLTPPSFAFFETCDQNGPVQNMTFGQTATLVVAVESDRPIQSSTAQLIQSSWAVNAPQIDAPSWDVDSTPLGCGVEETSAQSTEWLYFRLKLDNSLIDGPGRILFSVVDVDGLVRSESVDLTFQHAPTVFDQIEFSEVMAGEDLYANITVSNLDGLGEVVCTCTIEKQNDEVLMNTMLPAGPPGFLTNELLYRYPVPQDLGNTTLLITFSCVDGLQRLYAYNTTLEVAPSESCLNCADAETVNDAMLTEKSGQQTTLLLLLGSVIFVAVLIGLMLRRRTTRNIELSWDEDFPPLLGTEALFNREVERNLFDEDQQEDETAGQHNAQEVEADKDEDELSELLPEGWTVQAFAEWLKGPLPDGWTEEQWSSYVASSTAVLNSHNNESEG